MSTETKLLTKAATIKISNGTLGSKAPMISTNEDLHITSVLLLSGCLCVAHVRAFNSEVYDAMSIETVPLFPSREARHYMSTQSALGHEGEAKL